MAEPARDPQRLAMQALGRDDAAVDGVRRLFHEVFGHEVSAEHWRWKYGPAAGAQTLNWVAVGVEGPARPWGHVGARVMPGWWCGRPARLAHLTDVMVHPSLRGDLQRDTVYARLMRAMARALLEPGGPPLLAWGFPGLTPARLGARMGLYRPLQRVIRHHVHAAPSEGQSHASGLYALQALAAGALGFKVKPQGWDTPWLNRIWQRHADALCGPSRRPVLPSPPGPGSLSVQKDAAYCLWRYRDHPNRPYQLWNIQGPWRRAIGWLITRAEPEPSVVDALLPMELRTGMAWSRILIALASASGQPQWATWHEPDRSLTPFQSETNLIVPVEFRAAELTGAGPSIWTQVTTVEAPAHDHGQATARPRSSSAVPRPLQPPWFYPGDTDVF